MNMAWLRVVRRTLAPTNGNDVIGFRGGILILNVKAWDPHRTGEAVLVSNRRV
jgi:hypothetical protein